MRSSLLHLRASWPVPYHSRISDSDESLFVSNPLGTQGPSDTSSPREWSPEGPSEEVGLVEEEGPTTREGSDEERALGEKSEEKSSEENVLIHKKKGHTSIS